MLLGNKRDLEHLREVESHEGESLASQYKVAFSEVTLSHSKTKKMFSEIKILFRFQKIPKSKKLQKSLKMHIFASENSRVTYHF